MSARIPDRNGWFEVSDNPLSKVGVFDYLGSSIGAPNPTQMYKVFRPASELSNPETINSFRLVPFIINHRMLGKATSDSIPAEQKGVHGVTGDRIWFDEASQMLRGNIKIFSDTSQKLLADGVNDISLGYLCKYVYQPGIFEGQPYEYIQTNIYGNHAAQVPDGRMGDDVAVLDSLTATFDAKDMKPMSHVRIKDRNPKGYAAVVKHIVNQYAAKRDPKRKGKAIATMDADEESAVSSDPTLSDIADLLSDVMPQIASINEAMSGADPDDDDDTEAELDADGKPVMDAEGKPVMKKKVPAAAAATADPAKVAVTDKAMDKPAMDAAISAATKPLLAEIEKLKGNGIKGVLSEIAKRNELAGKLSHFVGAFDHSEMTINDVAKYGVDKLKIPAVSGQEVSSVNAWLHGREPSRPMFGMDSRDRSKKTSIDNYLTAAE